MSRIIDAPGYPADHRWPVTLRYGWLVLSPLRRRDIDELVTVRGRNHSWLTPWDPTTPRRGGSRASADWDLWDQARQGSGLPWLIRWREEKSAPIIGQCTVSNIVYGSAQSASIGYWIDRRYAGRWIVPAAVALATDYAITTLRLHRIEICVRPENQASLRVVQKLGFRYEGRRPRFIHIAGAWRDHEAYALTAEEMTDGLLARVPRSVVFPVASPGDPGR